MMNRVLKIKKFRDIKTGTQLFLGFGVVITLMLALSLVAWQQTSKLAMQTENLYSHPLQVRRALGKFETAITAIQRDMRELMLTNGDKEIEHLLTQIDISRAEAYRQLDILEKSYLGPLGDIKNMRTEFLKSNTQDDETVRLLRQGKINEALERTKPDGISGVQAQTLMKHTSVVDDFSRNKGDQFYNQSVQMKKELNNQLLLFAIAALLVSLVLAIFLSRLINNPLKELAGAMQSYRSGNKTVRSGYRSGNLFGKLSDSFNEMAGTLETENLISKRAAELSGIMLIEEEAHSFCHELLKNLLKHTDSQMGAVYLLNQDKSLFEVYLLQVFLCILPYISPPFAIHCILNNANFD